MDEYKSVTKHPMYHSPAYPPSVELTPEQIELVDYHNNAVKNGEIKLEAVACLCGSENFDLVATYDRYRVRNSVVLCHRCGLLQSRPRYTEEANFWFYNSGFHLDLYTPGGFKTPAADEFIVAAKQRDGLRERALQGLDKTKVRSVAEVGCQSGLNLYGFHLEGCSVFGCDFGPNMVEVGRQMGMDLRVGSTELLAGRTFDLIILAHVLEHMREPLQEIAKIVEYMDENTGLYIEVPNAEVFDISDLQSAHLYYFSPVTLAKFLSPLGLKPVSKSIANEIHFGMVFKRSSEVVDVDVSREFKERRRQIVKMDRRDRLKDALVATKLLPIARFIRNLFRPAASK